MGLECVCGVSGGGAEVVVIENEILYLYRYVALKAKYQITLSTLAAQAATYDH